MLAMEFGTGQVLWSILWFTLFFIWLWLVIAIFSDIIRARDMGGWTKAIWTILIILLPILGALLYLIVNGHKMTDRAIAQAEQMQAAQESYIRQVAGNGSSVADQLTKLSDLHAAGKLTDAEYAAAKAKLVS